MRILHVIPAIAPRYGGPSDAVLEYARGLEASGVESVILTTDADGPSRLPVDVTRTTRWRSVNVRFCRRHFGVNLKYSRVLARWLSLYVAEFDIVHIHSVFSHASVTAVQACLRRGIPYVLRPLGSLDPFTLSCKRLKKRLFLLVWGKKMLLNAAGIHYGTRRERDQVESTFGIGRGFVIPPGVPIAAANTTDARTAKHTGGPADGSPYVLYMGRLDPIKNIELLIDAFLSATRDHVCGAWKLVLAGDGDPDYVRELERRARRSDDDQRIVFTGWLEGREKASCFGAASLFALTSRHENFGRAAAEAMAAGIPVLLTNQVFLEDLVLEHDAGWVVPPRLGDVAGALHEAMSDAVLRCARGHRAHRLASDFLSATMATTMLIDRYRSIFEDCRHRAASLTRHGRPGPA